MAHLLHDRRCLRHVFLWQSRTAKLSYAKKHKPEIPCWAESPPSISRRVEGLRPPKERAQQCPHKVSSTISSVCLHRTAQVYEQLFSLRVALYTASGAAIRNPRPCILSSCSFPIFASAAGVAWKPATLGPFSEKAPSMTEISPSARTAEAVPQYAPPQQPACPANPIP